MKRAHKLITYLSEGLSKKLFHFTDIKKAANILRKDKFFLSAHINKDAESGDKLYYMSTTRSLQGNFHRETPHGVMFNLNGEELSHEYSGNPIDYWGHEFRKSDPTSHEMEDRVYSDERFIEPASRYIEEIHAVLHIRKNIDDPEMVNNMFSGLKKVVQEADKLGIPIYLYRNKEAWKLQDKRRAVEMDLSGYEAWKDDYIETKRPISLDDLHILNKAFEEGESALTKDDKKRLERYFGMDGAQGLQATLHNLQQGVGNDEYHEALDRFLKNMEKAGAQDLKAFLSEISNRLKKEGEEKEERMSKVINDAVGHLNPDKINAQGADNRVLVIVKGEENKNKARKIHQTLEKEGYDSSFKWADIVNSYHIEVKWK